MLQGLNSYFTNVMNQYANSTSRLAASQIYQSSKANQAYDSLVIRNNFLPQDNMSYLYTISRFPDILNRSTLTPDQAFSDSISIDHFHLDQSAGLRGKRLEFAKNIQNEYPSNSIESKLLKEKRTVLQISLFDMLNKMTQFDPSSPESKMIQASTAAIHSLSKGLREDEIKIYMNEFSEKRGLNPESNEIKTITKTLMNYESILADKSLQIGFIDAHKASAVILSKLDPESKPGCIKLFNTLTSISKDVASQSDQILTSLRSFQQNLGIVTQ